MDRQSVTNIIAEIRETLMTTFASIDDWFEKDEALLGYTPSYGGWTIAQILEHVYLTSHFLLILINKGVKKSIQRTGESDLGTELQNANFNKASLAAVGKHRAFQWTRPEHMEPTGEKTLAEVRGMMKAQL